MLNPSHTDSCLQPFDDGGEHVARLMYASQAQITRSTFEEIHHIRLRSMERNKLDRVNVALLYQNGWFMQWMEGPIKGLRAVLVRVENDPRHKNLRVLHQSSGRRRLTEPWSMAVVDTHEECSEFAHRVKVLHDEYLRHSALDPASIWRRLSTPLNHAGADKQAIRDHFQRVMVCSATGTDAFNLVAWLGQTTGTELVHRRFIGSRADILDVGTDYLDLPVGDGVRRVIAMARHGLDIGLTRAFLTDYSHVILLLSGVLKPDLALMERIVGACENLAHRPVIIGIEPSSACHGVLQPLAQARGLVYMDCDIAGSMNPEAQWALAEMALDQSTASNSVWPEAEKFRA